MRTWPNYVYLRSVTPENIKRKNELVDAIEMQLAAPQPESTVWREHVHQLVDELDALELPFAPSTDCASVALSHATG